MARRVFLHIGLPKTGTTYLQTIVWNDRPGLREQGLLVPGRERRDHLWSSLIVREDHRVARRNPRAPQAWDVVRAESSDWSQDVLISHEFFCSASAEQAARMVAELQPAEVHLVVTAREPLGLFTSSWQESLKNRATTPLADYGRSVSANPLDIWDWRALDLSLVLQRWAPTVPAERVHIVTMPAPGSPRSALWDRFATLLGVDPESVASDQGFSNSTMGVVEAETLRRMNAHLGAFSKAVDRGVWIRSFLADDRLVPRGGEKYWPDEDQQADCRRRGLAATELIRERGYDVIGELDSLLVPTQLPPRRHPDSVTDAEVAACAVELAATLLGDVRAASSALESDSASETDGPSDPARREPWTRRLRRA